ncbi:fatty acid desaturase [Pseudomonas oryzihabitans]|nr:fatty acid desaturase [Pseudomonas psychrotolerans]
MRWDVVVTVYLDTRHRRLVKLLARTFMARSEWPTWILLIGVYGGWLGLSAAWPLLGYWTLPPLILVVVLQQSLQHELIHGHPTPWPRINAALAYPPLGLWFPYPLYRDSHLAHHRREHLTDPALDPESRYVDGELWERRGSIGRGLLWLDKTLLGRILIGPLLALHGMVGHEVRRWRRGEQGVLRVWLVHLGCVTALLTSIQHFSGMPLLVYVLGIAWPALALALVRSFYEHRPAQDPAQRCVLNESAGVLRLLFLNNTLHLVHHDLPGLPWYLIPRVYRARRSIYRVRSGDFVFSGFRELGRRFAWQAVDAPVHPSARVSWDERAGDERPCVHCHPW